MKIRRGYGYKRRRKAKNLSSGTKNRWSEGWPVAVSKEKNCNRKPMYADHR